MTMIGAPTEREFQGLVRLNLLKDCPITNADIIHAHKIFGPDLPNLRGKTVRRKPERVRTDYVDIPRVILDVHGRVTLVADFMFVNGVPFLVSSSRHIYLITIEHAPQRTASKLGSLLQRIIRVYARAGFQVQTILMDNESEKVCDHVPHANLNILVASEHIGEIERKIPVIKERSCGILCTLLYARLLHQMLIHLLHHIVMWLNNFLVSGGVSDHFSPRELILRHRLDYPIIAMPYLDHIARLMKRTHQLIPCSPVRCLPFVLAPRAICKAHIIFSTLLRVTLSSVVVSMNFLLQTRLSSV
jgi:hypothetical protein